MTHSLPPGSHKTWLLTLLFVLILCLYAPASAQQGLNGRGCAECYDATAFGADTTVQIDNGRGCILNLTYAKRICNQGGAYFYDLVVRSVSVASGTGCSQTSLQDLATEATVLLLYLNPMNFPPYSGTPNQIAGWRLVRSSCWSEAPSGTLAPCPDSPCCEAVFGVYYNSCGQMVLNAAPETKNSGSCGSRPEGGTCTNICAEDLLEEYNRISSPSSH